jgi:antitoxin component of MazEF toxin-antitoxin module
MLMQKKENNRIVMTSYTLPRGTETRMSHKLVAFLSRFQMEELAARLWYCVEELLVNAKKANTKRVYFWEKQLDIADAAAYDKGMQSFRSDTFGDIDRYLQLQKEAKLYIKLILREKDDAIEIEVRNNVELLPNEYRRMHDKLARASQYNAEDTFNQTDEAEGAGLGLAIIVLFLKQIGLSEANLAISSEKGKTSVCLCLPISLTDQNSCLESYPQRN